jgi:hypothetical protein
MNFDLDIAATLSAVIWPIIVLVILLAYRSKIPSLVEGLASRVSKLEFAGVSLELALAKPFVPEWSGSSTALDLRHKATAIQVNDSTARTFLTQLTDEGTGDYAEINLGAGGEWLTSRLFIMAIVFAQMKGIGCFVFVETSGSVRKRFVGWAEPARIHWALAKRYPWLEQAYAEAYAAISSQRNAVIVSRHGRLGYPHAPGDPGAGIELLKEFLQRIQQPVPPPPIPAEQEEWIVVDPATNTHEHACWMNAEELERVLGDDCNTVVVHSSELRSKNKAGQLRLFLSVPAQFVAVVADDQRFEYLVRRDVLVEQVAKRMASETDGRN